MLIFGIVEIPCNMTHSVFCCDKKLSWHSLPSIWAREKWMTRRKTLAALKMMKAHFWVCPEYNDGACPDFLSKLMEKIEEADKNATFDEQCSNSMAEFKKLGGMSSSICWPLQ